MTKQDIAKPGSLPMKPDRLERFAKLIAESDGGLSLVAAWCISDPAEMKPEVTPGRRVSASKAMKRVGERVAWLKQIAVAPAPIEKLTAERLSSLMEETTASLLDAARHAQKAGANNIGNPNGAAALRQANKGNSDAIRAIKARANARARDLSDVLEDVVSNGNITLKQQARELNRRGIKTARGGRWHPSSVSNLRIRLAAPLLTNGCSGVTDLTQTPYVGDL